MKVLAIKTNGDTFYARDGGAFIACYDFGMVLALLGNQLPESINEMRILDAEDSEFKDVLYADLTDGDFAIDAALFEKCWNVATPIYQKGA